MARATDSAARERILDTAGKLFYQHGYHAVGVDTIIAEANVAKMTLYRHFASKEELIVAYLERANAQVLGLFDDAAAAETEPLAQLHAVCRLVARIAGGPQCLGCVFQLSAAEFPAHDHPAHRVALGHKRAVRERLLRLATAARLRNPDQLADQLLLLIDGAWVAARMFGAHSPAESLVPAADALIRAQRPGRPERGALEQGGA